MLTVNDEAIVGGVGILSSHVEELMRGNGRRGGGGSKVGDVEGGVRRSGDAEE